MKKTEITLFFLGVVFVVGCSGGGGSSVDTGDSVVDTVDGSDPVDTVDTGDSAVDTGDSDSETAVGPGCETVLPSLTAEGVAFSGCSSLGSSLVPWAKIDGAWLGGTDCALSSGELVCSVGDAGSIVTAVDGNRVTLRFTAEKQVILRSLGLRGEVELPGVRGFLSNGFQSWSQSGVVALAPEPAMKTVENLLRATGETEVYRDGKHVSWWYSFLGSDALSVFAGAVSAKRWKSWVHFHRTGDAGRYGMWLHSGAGEAVAVEAGASVASEPWILEAGEDLEDILARYGDELPSWRRDHPVAAPTGWNSWYDLWDKVKVEDVVSPDGPANADLAAEHLGPVVPEANKPMWIVVDDGWQQEWGDWVPGPDFPDGMADLAGLMAKREMRLGVWLAPLLASPKAPAVVEHPEWFIKGVAYNHPNHGNLKVLDVTNPEAAEYLGAVIETLVGWGIGLLKIDFLFAGAFEGQRYEDVTGMEGYHRALSIIREAAGSDVVLLAVGAPPIATFAHVDGWRIGNDIAFTPVPVIDFPKPSWSFIANQGRQIASRWHLCRAVLCDADPPLLRHLPRNEVDAGVWVAASTGGAFFLSDDLRKLDEERFGWGLGDTDRIAMGLGGQPVRMESSYPETIPNYLKNMRDDFFLFNAEHQVPSVWLLPDGRRLAINFAHDDRVIDGVEVPSHTAVMLP